MTDVTEPTGITYDQDLTGINPKNRIMREPHPVSEITAMVNDMLVLDFEPHFPNDFLIESLDENGIYRPLEVTMDFEHRYPWYSLNAETGIKVFGATKINVKPTMPMLYVTYQTFGGKWNADRKKVLEALANYVYNPRFCTFDQISNIQETFPPNQHQQDLQNFVRWDAIEEQMARLVDKLGEPVEPSLLFQQQTLAMLESNAKLLTEYQKLSSLYFDLQQQVAVLNRRL